MSPRPASKSIVVRIRKLRATRLLSLQAKMARHPMLLELALESQLRTSNTKECLDLIVMAKLASCWFFSVRDFIHGSAICDSSAGY